MTSGLFAVDPGAPNVMPSRYRQVSVSEVPSLEPGALLDHFAGREAYFQTRFVVARRGDDCALVELARPRRASAVDGAEPLFRGAADGPEPLFHGMADGADGGEPLFSAPAAVRVLAEAGQCAYRRDQLVDTGIGTQMAAAAAGQSKPCVIVEGRYRHVSFILNPAPLPVEVVDVVPPQPAKLVDQVRRVLEVAEELPPLKVLETVIDSRDLLAGRASDLPDGVLVPCRGGGVDVEGAVTSYLDQRPAAAEWTLLGCDRSRQIHAWFYGEPPAGMVDTCPMRLLAGPESHREAGGPQAAPRRDALTATVRRNFETPPGGAQAAPRREALGSAPGAAKSKSGRAEAAPTSGLRLSRCCLLSEGVEVADNTAWAPWGATLAEVRAALGLLTTAASAEPSPVAAGAGSGAVGAASGAAGAASGSVGLGLGVGVGSNAAGAGSGAAGADRTAAEAASG